VKFELSIIAFKEIQMRIYDAGLKRAARSSLQIQDAKSRQKIAIWAPSHNFVDKL